MLVFNEGVPRAGKSYDAVKNHILPALKKGRTVFARLNGLRHDLIAERLGLAESDVRALLIDVDTKDVARTFVCHRDEETGQWRIADRFKDALVVIDEVHEFYVNERKPLPPEVENFWALLGQNGGDAVIMTQWINRLHSAVKARIEKKHSFQKLTAVGMKGRYRITYWHTVSAGKFEKVGSKTEKYEAWVFPLYDGYAPGAENTEVYEEGGTNVWAAMAVRATAFAVIAGVGLYFLVSFFVRGESVKDAPAQKIAAGPSASPAVGQVFKPGQAVPAPGEVAKVVVDPLADLKPEQRYVMELADKGRIRLAAVVQFGDDYRAWVQWIDASNNVLEQLDLAQLQALGFAVSVERYGVRLAAGEHVLIATAWPWTAPVREPDARLYNLAPEGSAAGADVVSVANDGGAGGAIRGSTVARATRAQGTFPESPGYHAETSTRETTLDL